MSCPLSGNFYRYYVASKLAKGFLRTNNFDTNSRLCMASAAVGSGECG